MSVLEYYSLCGKVNFSVIHPTHITIYSFWRTMFSFCKPFVNYRKKLHFNRKNNDDWTFLIFFLSTIVFPLEPETWFYYLTFIITTDTSLLRLILHYYDWYFTITTDTSLLRLTLHYYDWYFIITTDTSLLRLILHYYDRYFIITTDTSSTQMGCSKTRKWILK